jgi:hypothetical protein
MPLELTEWVDVVFGGASPREARDDSDRATLLRLCEVFENAATVLKPYPDQVLNRAFWDLSSDAFHATSKESIDWAVRERFIRSFEPLFREFFAARCQPVLGHLSEEGSPLNTPCYMWWDFDCWVAATDPLERNPLDSAFLESMEAILAIPHVACQESALHGLGHWYRAHSAKVGQIIGEFLKQNPDLSKDLRSYAQSACYGCVL